MNNGFGNLEDGRHGPRSVSPSASGRPNPVAHLEYSRGMHE